MAAYFCISGHSKVLESVMKRQWENEGIDEGEKNGGARSREWRIIH